MIRLRGCAATARQARLRSFAASARQGRLFLATVLAVMIFGGSTLLACPVCVGAKATPMIDGARLGVLVLLAITLAVQGGFVGFFLYLRKRAKRIADDELDTEWSELQPSPTSS
jgi:hypothetical protein